MPDLLIELLSEEIPARMQARAADDLRRLVTDGLVEGGLTYRDAAGFATPRRLALSVTGLTAESRAVREERKGPAVGAPDKAVEGFARSAGVARDALTQRDVAKGRAWFAVVETPGRPAAAIVAEVLERTIRGFPWPKSMRWGEGSLRWVRPLQGILCLLADEGGAEVVELTIEGIRAGRESRGHRFLAPEAFSVSSFDDYEAKLKRAKVLLRSEARAEAIWHDATNLAFASGLEVIADRGLLDEVAGLVEWPMVLMGTIGADFLDLPPEVLRTSMRTHQKFFAACAPDVHRRITHFVTVANVETPDDGATILAGNAKVLAARLSDAKFFWENDLAEARSGMDAWREGLEAVTFHNRLGSQADRIARIAALAREIAPLVGADPDAAETAARIAKLDLRSEMVGEFPELQGVMGRYYAEAAGYPPEIAAAAEEHYSPLGPSDEVPTAPVSVAVALADKIDTLTGFFAIGERSTRIDTVASFQVEGERPTGSKDPFALRRAALGIVRLILRNSDRVNLRREIFAANKAFIERMASQSNLVMICDSPVDSPMRVKVARTSILSGDVKAEVSAVFCRVSDPIQARDKINRKEQYYLEANEIIHAVNLPTATEASLMAFIHDRLKVHLRDAGVRHDVIDACLAMPNADDLVLLVKRAEALSAFLKTDDGENLVQGFRRANNILTQAEERDGVEYSFGADRKFAEHPAEVALFDALDAAEAEIAPAMAREDFSAAMAAMARLRQPIDAFFEAVQVNAESQVLRRNRLNLLSRIRSLCLSVADLTRLEG